MLCFNDHTDTARLQFPHQRISDLHREILLDLEAPGKHIDDARHLRQTNDFAVRDISDVSFPDKREQMMFAHGVELDVLHQNDFARFGLEQSIVDEIIEALTITCRQELKRTCRATRSLYQSFPMRIFTDRLKQAEEGLFQVSQPRCSATWDLPNPALRRFELGFVIGVSDRHG